MAKRKKNKKPRQIGKQSQLEQKGKKPFLKPKHRSTIWTILILVILIIFFIINNTRDVPGEGQYPPNYNPNTTRNELSGEN